MKLGSAKGMLALSAAASAFVVLQARGQSAAFTFSYEADYLPQSPLTAPQWAKVLDSDEAGPNTSESVSGGILTTYTANKADYLEYRMDGGAGLNWNPTGAGSTLEVRLKTDFNASGADWAGNLVIGTGSRAWTLGIGTNYISNYGGGGDLVMPTSDKFHTYRFTIGNEVDGPLALYVDGASTPSKVWSGTASTTNRIGFGDATDANEGGQIQWDYLRWTNNGRFAPEVVPAKSGEADFGNQYIRQHPMAVMGEVAGVTPGGTPYPPFDVAKYRAMNMNTVFVAASTSIAHQSARAGIDWHMMMNIGPSEPLTDAHKTLINSLIRQGHATGWYLPDEPTTQAQFDNVSAYARWMNENHPEMLTYVNTFDGDLGSLNTLVNTVRPDALMFDSYPFSNTSTTSSNWFQMLMNVRQVSQAHQIPYGGWLQSFHLSGWNLRTPSESDTRFNAYTLLTAGYKMLNYYIYDDGVYAVTSTFLDANGNPTPTYHYTATANREYATLGKTLRFLSSTDVRFVPGQRNVLGFTVTNSAPDGLGNWSAGAGGDAHIQNVAVAGGQLGAEKNGMIGFFMDDAGESYFMLTNLNHGANLSAASTSLNFSITFDATINEILRLNRTTGVQELLTLTNHQLNWTLPGGTGDLFKYNTGDFVGQGWCMDASGDWNADENWGGGIPNAVDATAKFGDVLIAARTIYADSAVTVGSLRFNSLETYQITGTGSLAIDVSSGTGLISAVGGTHKINLPLFIRDNTVADIASGATLKISDPMTLVGNVTLTKTGTGTLNIEAPVYHAAAATIVSAAGVTSVQTNLGATTTVNVLGGTTHLAVSQNLAALNVSGGVAAIGPSAAVTVTTRALSLTGTGQVDLRNSKMIVDYDGVSALSAVKTMIDTGALTSSQMSAGLAIGFGEASDLFNGLAGSFNGQPVDSSSVVIALTVQGDASLDGVVNSTDFNLLASHYGNIINSRWTQGDFDGDGKVNTLDFNLLAGQFGQSLPTGIAQLGSVIPEPGSLLAGTILLLAGCRRRR